MDNQKALLEQYKLVHDAVQECHKHAWTMTGIFVPLIAAGLGVFFQQLDSLGILPLWGFGISIIVTCVFWYKIMAYLRKSNQIRIRLLRQCEDNMFGDDNGGPFKYYNQMKKVKVSDEKSKGEKFSASVKYLLVSVVVVVIFTLMFESFMRLKG